MHAPSAQRIGNFQVRESLFVGEQGLRLDDGSRLVLEVFHHRPAVGRFARFGNGRDVVEIKFFGGTDLRFHQHAVVGGVGKILCSDLIGREHHGNGHDRQAIHRPPIQNGEKTFAAIHNSSCHRMFPGVAQHGAEVFMRSIAHHLAARAHDKSVTGLFVAFRHGGIDLFRRAIAQNAHRIDISQ